RAVDLLVELDVTDGERSQGLAVIAVGEGDEALPPCRAEVAPVVEAHLHRDLNRGGAVVGVEAAREALRGDSAERFRERDHRLVGGGREGPLPAAAAARA